MFDGGCACGAVRYRLTSRPMFVNCCHCRDCQRHTGSAFVVNAIIETDRAEVMQGEIEPVSVPAGRHIPQVIHRCASCRTAVWSIYGGMTKVRFVRVGTLDDPTVFDPNAHIFVKSKLPWVLLPKDIPAFEVYYDFNTTWPPQSLERRRVLYG